MELELSDFAIIQLLFYLPMWLLLKAVTYPFEYFQVAVRTYLKSNVILLYLAKEEYRKLRGKKFYYGNIFCKFSLFSIFAYFRDNSQAEHNTLSYLRP